jgi:hypothetical protein
MQHQFARNVNDRCTYRCAVIARFFAAYEDGSRRAAEFHEAGRVDSDPVHRQKRDEWGVSVAGARCRNPDPERSRRGRISH